MKESPATLPPGAVIAIDGPAASGKGTLARRLAAYFGLAYLDTGLLYRAVGLRLLRAGRDPHDAAAAAAAAQEVGPGDLKNPELRSEAAGNAAGVVAANPGVRAALATFQQQFATSPPGGAPGAVLDGRDIGTVIWPQTPFKLFIEASLEVRAARRVKELQENGVESIHARILRDMEERDTRDRGRAVAPLVPATDALMVDTTARDADQAFELAVRLLVSRKPSEKDCGPAGD